MMRLSLLLGVVQPPLARAMRTGVARMSMAAATVTFEPLSAAPPCKKLLLCGRKEALLSDGARAMLPKALSFEMWTALVDSVDAGDDGDKASSMFMGDDGVPATIVAAVLPEACSRHNSPIRPAAVTSLVAGLGGDAAVVALLDDPAHAGGVACAIGRAFPLYSDKLPPKEPKPAPNIRVGFATANGPLDSSGASYAACASACDGVRRAARIVDLPPDVLTTTGFVNEAKLAVKRLEAQGKRVEVQVISGEALKEGGYGFLYGVGKAAVEPPALVILSHLPSKSAAKTVALVGVLCMASWL